MKVQPKENSNQNSTAQVMKLNIRTDDQCSDTTVYRKAVQPKRVSSSSEDGLDISDESNLLTSLNLDSSEQECTMVGQQHDKTDSQCQSTGRHPQQDVMAAKEISPEEQAANAVRLLE